MTEQGKFYNHGDGFSARVPLDSMEFVATVGQQTIDRQLRGRLQYRLDISNREAHSTALRRGDEQEAVPRDAAQVVDLKWSSNKWNGRRDAPES